jgi:two-component system response regulator PilR (NtrC family)
MQPQLQILVVDDEKIQRETLASILSDHGYATTTAEDVKSAVEALRELSFDVVLTDFRIPGGSGLEVARRTSELCPDAVSLVMTAYADVTSVIEAMRLGVADYLVKPLNVEALLRRLQIIRDRRELQLEVSFLRTAINRATDPGTLLGLSPQISTVRELIAQVAQTRGTVLITGESGTGKEVAARQIHAMSAQAAQKFVAINCGAVPENLLESELFGHKKGAFTGAIADKPGLVAVADEGSLFLDEIGDMPKALQVKLLRVLQEREFVPLGETRPVKVNIRVIAATNRDLTSAVASGAFRQDLYYRINVVELRMPPLRERLDDIPLLARHFIEKYAREFGRPMRGLSGEACRALMRYPWPGNVRELENVVERALILSGSGDMIGLSDLPISVVGDGAAQALPVKLEDAVKQFSRTHILSVLKATAGDKKEAAKALGISLSSLYRKLEELGIGAKSEGEAS